MSIGSGMLMLKKERHDFARLTIFQRGLRVKFSCWLPVCRAAFLFLLFFFVREKANAQAGSPIVFQPTVTTISSSNEELTDFMIKIVNKQAIPLLGVMNVNLPASLDLISKNKIAVNLQPGDSTFVPVKIFITKRTASGKEHIIRFLLTDRENNALAASEIPLRVSVKRNVNMYSLLTNILLDPSSDSIKIPIRITNPGNTAQKITVINRYPSIFQDDAFHITRQFTIQPSADTIITFTKPIVKKMLSSEGFDVTFSGLYDNGDIFGMAYIRIQSARNQRAYRDESLSDSYNLNSITLSSQSMFSPNQSYLLTGRGNLELPKGMVGYNLDFTTWRNSYSPPMARSTYLSYSNQKFGITAGNINKNIDINLSGRGGSIFLNDTASNNSYEVGFIDGNANLLGNRFNTFVPSGNAGWGSFTHTGESWELATSAVYEANPVFNSRSAIVGNSFTFTKVKGLRMTASASGGYTTEYENGTTFKPSIAGGVNINGTLNKILINSQNYYSSAYYPGMRRGALSFNERITWLRENSNIWGGVDYNHYEPKTLSSFQTFMPVFSTMRVEAGMSGTIFKKLNVSVAPVYTRETNNAYKFSGLADERHSMEAWNVNNSFNFSLSDNQYVSLNTETGFYSSTFDSQKRFHFRSNLNYRRGMFNLSSTVQSGTFYIGEAANNFLRDVESPRLINIIPSFQKSFYRNKLRTELGLAFINSSLFGSSSYLTGRAEYDLTPKTSVYSAINHNRYGDYNLSILEMGITQKLTLPKVGAKDSDLEVFAYQDANQNSVFDEGDTKAAGHLLYINNVAFITGSGGLVEYKKLPYGDYRVSLTNVKGWYSPDEIIKLDQKKERLEIALKRTGTLRGTLGYSFNEFSYEINRNLQGITVIAIDEKNIRHITKTNSEGQYVFYLPIGRYTVSVDSGNLPAEVEAEKKPGDFQLNAESPQVIDFKLLVKVRKIETKKFTSPNAAPRN
ncbi:carboxypeptidase-like regulatory domain-containing protein [Daejeonella sp. JGW-45]|uniref:carboxypeptidase-like regulatory domain-containing protein n=1 Tax=Daejeonella sp. JGW-45 TaxID=3034148 RepID=UPI0023EDF2F8|nr:carboxypeptidase-like regulatory domain-containing protein [Daejeonella sp. JGW-45]